MALISFQGLASIFELLAVNLDDKLFWRNAQQIPLYYSPIMLLGVIMSFVGTTNKVTNWSIAILSFITLCYWILLFTDTQHHLIRGTVMLETYGQLERIKFDRTHLGYLFLMYNKLMGVWGLVLLLINFRKVYGIQKTQLILLIVAIISPFFFPELASLAEKPMRWLNDYVYVYSRSLCDPPRQRQGKSPLRSVSAQRSLPIPI